jgi:hypothetical protein
MQVDTNDTHSSARRFTRDRDSSGNILRLGE